MFVPEVTGCWETRDSWPLPDQVGMRYRPHMIRTHPSLCLPLQAIFFSAHPPSTYVSHHLHESVIQIRSESISPKSRVDWLLLRSQLVESLGELPAIRRSPMNQDTSSRAFSRRLPGKPDSLEIRKEADRPSARIL